MPPPVIDSDSDSVAEEIPHHKTEPSEQVQEELEDAVPVKEEFTAKENGDNGADNVGDDDGEDDENDDDSEVYIVEAILNHDASFEDRQIRYEIKWKGYEKKSERTWEIEENLSGASELLQEYWEKIGGKPTAIKGTKKRGRQSTGEAITPDTSKKPKIAPKTERKNLGTKKSRQSLPDVSLVGTEAPEEGWKPPEGSWEDHIQSVETVEKDDDDNLWAYVIWNHRTSEGKFIRSRHPADKGERSCYEKCPKKMLQFYQRHLVFTEGKARRMNGGI
ncbi:Chromo domain/shadow [Lasallia pustulata]|uniref:Chromo domain/shadow n=1 Tax=Lasallia pustulata TaxID=136370 RepID=A0A1W5D1K0_9LECA|nr:Chromo domain/shadow [Lasallia pustulata]